MQKAKLHIQPHSSKGEKFSLHIQKLNHHSDISNLPNHTNACTFLTNFMPENTNTSKAEK
jgi:hypothetical protein